MTSIVPSSIKTSLPYCSCQCEANQKPAKAAIRFERRIPGLVKAMKSLQVAVSPGGVGLTDNAADSEEA